MTRPAQRKSMMQAFLGTIITGGFLCVVGWQTWQGTLDADMKQTLITITVLAVGFFLGSSYGSNLKTENAQELALQPPPEEPVP